MPRSILAGLLLCVLTACFGSTPPPEPKPREIPTSEGKPSELSEDELIFRAKRYYEVGLYSESRENFDALRNTFPLGAYGEFAEIKSADALFDTGAYGDAAKSYEDIARNRPVSEALPYVLFKAGRSYQLSQRGVGRDMTALEKAHEKYEDLLRRFPNSRHAWAAKEFDAEVLKAQAEYAESIRDFYQHHGKKTAAETRDQRIKNVIAPAVIAATERANLDDRGESITKELVQLRAQAEKEQFATRASASQSTKNSEIAAIKSNPTSPAIPNATYRIVRANCRIQDQHIQATVFLNKDLNNYGWLDSVANSTTFKLPDAVAEPDVASTPCGAASDYQLNIEKNGEISLTGKQARFNPADTTVTTLPNPPRLLIIAAVQ